MTWTTADIGDQTGRTAIITGANTGLGLETAASLAAAGARTVLACRNLDKAAAAREEILRRGATGDVEVLNLDLSDLEAVATAADEALDRFERIDLLINNAGVMIPPLERTAQGHELQFGTNHLGHFAFTGRLIDRVIATENSRVINVSSAAHAIGRMRWHDLDWTSGYNRLRAYGMSKLANLLFTYELDRRLADAHRSTTSLAAHPGSSATELVRYIPGSNVRGLSRVFDLGVKAFAQPADMGALPTLRAAVDPEAQGSEYYGPDGFRELMGHPVRVMSTGRARRTEDWLRLWDVSVDLTGVAFDI